MSLEVNIESEEFNTTELHDSIEKVAKIKGIEDFEYQVEFVCDKNEGYVANLFRVLINERGKENGVSVIVKMLINSTRKELFGELHTREVFVYNEVLPRFNAIQNSINEDDKLVLPECVLSVVDKGKDIIILEDLALKNFKIDGKRGKFEKLDYLQVRLVLSELAKLHGLSFVFAKKDPDTFEKISLELRDIIFEEKFLNKSKLRTYFNETFAASLKVITDDDVRKKLQKVEPKLLDIFRKYVEAKKINVLCHGDCWINNVLFKHQDRKQSQICFIDFQATRYANPVTDILYFMYLCTDSEFRSEHFDTLQNVYYESLKYFLRMFNMDVKDVYPKDDFTNDLQENLPFGLLAALIDMKTLTHDNDDIISRNTDTDEVISTNVKESSNVLFSIKINDVVKEFVENGVLDKFVEELNV